MMLNRSQLNRSQLNIWLRQMLSRIWGRIIVPPKRVYDVVVVGRVVTATPTARVWAATVGGRVWAVSASPRNYSIVVPVEPEDVR